MIQYFEWSTQGNHFCCSPPLESQRSHSATEAAGGDSFSLFTRTLKLWFCHNTMITLNSRLCVCKSIYMSKCSIHTLFPHQQDIIHIFGRLNVNVLILLFDDTRQNDASWGLNLWVFSEPFFLPLSLTSTSHVCCAVFKSLTPIALWGASQQREEQMHWGWSWLRGCQPVMLGLFCHPHLISQDYGPPTSRGLNCMCVSVYYCTRIYGRIHARVCAYTYTVPPPRLYVCDFATVRHFQ